MQPGPLPGPALRLTRPVTTGPGLKAADPPRRSAPESVLLAKILQPGRYTPVRSGQAEVRNLAKYLQISTVAGHASTGRNSRGATLDQLVKVRILLRQLPKSPANGSFLFAAPVVTSVNPRPPSPRYGKGCKRQTSYLRCYGGLIHCLCRQSPCP